MGQTYIDFFGDDWRDPPQSGQDQAPLKSLSSGSSFGPVLLKIISYKKKTLLEQFRNGANVYRLFWRWWTRPASGRPWLTPSKKSEVRFVVWPFIVKTHLLQVNRHFWNSSEMGQTLMDFFRDDGRDPSQEGRDQLPQKSLRSGS
jgi:hypothetical protein